MSENTTVENVVETNGATIEHGNYEARVFTSLEDAKAHKPAKAGSKSKSGEDKWKVFRVTRPESHTFFDWAAEKYPELVEEFREEKIDPKEGYCWGFHGQAAVCYVGRADGYDVEAAEGGRRGGRVDTKTTVNNVLNNYSEEQLRDMGINENMITMLLAARQGSTNAQAHVEKADEERDSSTPSPKSGKGRNRNK